MQHRKLQTTCVHTKSRRRAHVQFYYGGVLKILAVKAGWYEPNSVLFEGAPKTAANDGQPNQQT